MSCPPLVTFSLVTRHSKFNWCCRQELRLHHFVSKTNASSFRPRQLKKWCNGVVGYGTKSVSAPSPPLQDSITPFRNWSARQELHLRSLGPKPSMLLLHYALVAPACSSRRSRRTGPQPWRRSCGSSLKMADPNPDLSGLNRPVDNGLLWLFALRIQFEINNSAFFTLHSSLCI